MERQIEQAAEVIRSAEALVITAGAGMGVDSGLPDFRGPEGFWTAYPAYRKLGLQFEELASPQWFREDPQLAWGFYGHRLALYRATMPHAGFDILRRWAERMPGGYFVITSNVDGHFQRACFPDQRILECHGSIHWMQCLALCGIGIYPAPDETVDVDPETLRACGLLPGCPRCSSIGRPNVLMFNDWEWDSARVRQQEARFNAWISPLRSRSGTRVAVVECGAGTAISTIRHLSESICERYSARLIRINPRDCRVPPGQISLPCGALEALRGIEKVPG